MIPSYSIAQSSIVQYRMVASSLLAHPASCSARILSSSRPAATEHRRSDDDGPATALGPCKSRRNQLMTRHAKLNEQVVEQTHNFASSFLAFWLSLCFMPTTQYITHQPKIWDLTSNPRTQTPNPNPTPGLVPAAQQLFIFRGLFLLYIFLEVSSLEARVWV